MFQGTTEAIEKQAADVDAHLAAIPDKGHPAPQAVGGETDARQQIMSDLLEIEESLNARKRQSMPAQDDVSELSGAAVPDTERRQHHRVAYPADQRPRLSVDGRMIPILDLSSAGMRLEPDAAMADSHIVRGAIAFPNRSPVKITGKVVRQDDAGLGFKLVTRIGNRILDQERLRLRA
jgi:hypothetical protein